MDVIEILGIAETTDEEIFTVDDYEEYDELGIEKKQRRERVARSRKKAASKGRRVLDLFPASSRDVSVREQKKLIRDYSKEKSAFKKRYDKQTRRKALALELRDAEIA